MKEARWRYFLYKMITLLLLGIILVGAGIIAMLLINGGYGSGGSITNARYVFQYYAEVTAL